MYDVGWPTIYGGFPLLLCGLRQRPLAGHRALAVSHNHLLLSAGSKRTRPTMLQDQRQTLCPCGMWTYAAHITLRQAQGDLFGVAQGDTICTTLLQGQFVQQGV
jgi:hypothetical protein